MEMRGTTICAVRKDGVIAIAGDGQITMGESVILKGSAKKVKRLYNDKVVMGFAGSVSDALTLSEKFEKMLQKYSGNLMRSAVELAQMWRNDKFRKLEAMMIIADKNTLLLVSGTGEVIDPDGDACAIGSGGNYALAAARALINETNLSAKEIAYKALKIASDLCVYTNDNITVEEV
ncbi:MAG: ATP-dependent protease subunit HslV [Clostridia bacterium]|nr:ATP-dependent protease subunit HslV [Clostridia bacterium]MDY4083452.1 ATP-dependent protease subunit HslV [Eubacteriales bacterium]